MLPLVSFPFLNHFPSCNKRPVVFLLSQTALDTKWTKKVFEVLTRGVLYFYLPPGTTTTTIIPILFRHIQLNFEFCLRGNTSLFRSTLLFPDSTRVSILLFEQAFAACPVILPPHPPYLRPPCRMGDHLTHVTEARQSGVHPLGK